LQSFLDQYDPLWVDLLSIVIPVFLAFLIGFFFASIAENLRNKYLKKKLKAKTEEYDRTDSELKQMIKEYNVLKNKAPEKETKSIVKYDQSYKLELQSLKAEYDKYKSANVTLMEDNLAKEKEILRLNNAASNLNLTKPNAATTVFQKKPTLIDGKKTNEATEAKAISPVRKVDLIYELNKIVGESRKTNKTDLTKIMGIGESLALKLNSFGIYNFDQVSKLNERAADLLEELTGLSKQKIEDNKWVAQANSLK